MFQPFQHPLAFLLLHDRVTQRSGEPLEDTCREQKGLYVLWLPSEHLLGQIVQDVALMHADLLQHGERISVLWERKTKQLQAYQPALCPSSHFLNRILRKLGIHHLIEESSCLLCCATQLVGVDFQQLSVCPQLWKW